MFTREGLLALHHWTHLSLDRVFAHCAALPAELFTRQVADFPHGDLRNELVHGVEITHAFHHKGQVAALCRLLGHPMGPTDLRFG